MRETTRYNCLAKVETRSSRSSLPRRAMQTRGRSAATVLLLLVYLVSKTPAIQVNDDSGRNTIQSAATAGKKVILEQLFLKRNGNNTEILGRAVAEDPSRINDQLLCMLTKDANARKNAKNNLDIDQQADQTVIVDLEDASDFEHLEDALSLVEYEPQRIQKKFKRKVIGTIADHSDAVGSGEEEGVVPETERVYYEVGRTVQKNRKIPQDPSSIEAKRKASKNVELVYPTPLAIKKDRPRFSKNRVQLNPEPSLQPVSKEDTKPDVIPHARTVPSFKRIRYTSEPQTTTTINPETPQTVRSTRRRTRKRVAEKIHENNEKTSENRSPEGQAKSKRSGLLAKYDVAPRPFAVPKLHPGNVNDEAVSRLEKERDGVNRVSSRNVNLQAPRRKIPSDTSGARVPVATKLLYVPKIVSTGTKVDAYEQRPSQQDVDESSSEQLKVNENPSVYPEESSRLDYQNFQKLDKTPVVTKGATVPAFQDYQNAGTIESEDNLEIKRNPLRQKLYNYNVEPLNLPQNVQATVNLPRPVLSLPQSLQSSVNLPQPILGLPASHRSNVDVYRSLQGQVPDPSSQKSTLGPSTTTNPYPSASLTLPAIIIPTNIPDLRYDGSTTHSRIPQDQSVHEIQGEKIAETVEDLQIKENEEPTNFENKRRNRESDSVQAEYKIHETPDEHLAEDEGRLNEQSRRHVQDVGEQDSGHLEGQPDVSRGDYKQGVESQGHGQFAETKPSVDHGDQYIAASGGGGESEESGGSGGSGGGGGGGKDSGGSSEYVQGGEAEHQQEHHEVEGQKGEKGYKDYHEHDKSNKGHHEKERKSNYYDEKEGKEKDTEEEGGYHEEHEEGAKGKKEAVFGEKGGHQKGHSTKGEHFVHKKDEFEKKTEFFDEFHEDGDSERDGEHYVEHEVTKGGHEKTSHSQQEDHQENYGKEAEHKKGGHYNENKGRKIEEVEDSHYDREEARGEKGALDGGKKWAYKKSEANGGGGGDGGAGGGEGAKGHR